MEQLSNNALLQSYLLSQPIRLEICHEKLMSTAKNTGDAILLRTTLLILFFFFFYIYVCPGQLARTMINLTAY